MRSTADAVARLLPIVVVAFVSGCAWDLAYLARQGVGQAELLFAAQPVGRLLADATVSTDVKRRLALATAARQFAKDVVGLDVKQQYKKVVFLDAPAVVYVVSAAPPTELRPYTWSYPWVGALPYRGSFDLAEAEAEADVLERRGFDVSVRLVSTYSLLGVLPDPILSSMLYRREELDIVETVIHELAHATVFAPGQGAFNEGLATFVGRQGRRQFVAEHFGPHSAVARRASAIDDDDDAWVRAVQALAFDLRVRFAQGGEADTLVDDKASIYQAHQRHWQLEVAPTLFSMSTRSARLPENNAELSAVGIYSLKQQLYEEAFDGCGGDWGCFVGLLRSVAGEPDPEVALAERARTRTREVLLP
ncbi:MAG: aminopeptidase [Deltaproteobacteria bacterium]|nr:aminopeptidase [Deltaproteobacteria bacterium]